VLKTKQSAPALSLDEQIAELHARIDAMIESKAAELRKVYEGTFSHEALAHGIRVKAWGCPCEQYRALIRDES
jgi:hypothetical protein